MQGPSVRVTFDPAAVRRNKQPRLFRAQKALDSQALKDSNYYIPKQEGFLERSGLGSVPGSGLLIWAASYAKRMYHFGGTPSKKVNPNASVKWFERARAIRAKAWEALVNREYRS